MISTEALQSIRSKHMAKAFSMTQAIRYILESRDLYGHNLCTGSLSFSWVPIDSDLVTLNLPALFPSYYLHADCTWPQFMGLELGELLEATFGNEWSTLDYRVHAFGEAAQVVAAGLRLHMIRSGLSKGPSESSKRPPAPVPLPTTSPHSTQGSRPTTNGVAPPPPSSVASPLIIIFSRNLDYVTPMLIPMTFEALIHETMGIDLGMLELTSAMAGQDAGSKKHLLNSEKMTYYKTVRDVHISQVHNMLESWRTGLQDNRSNLELEMATRCSGPTTSAVTSLQGAPPHRSGNQLSSLQQIGQQVGPLLMKRRELTFLFAALEQIMETMTRRERIEDVRAAQTILLKSGSGGCLATAKRSTSPEEEDVGSSTMTDSVKLTGPSAGGGCLTAADDAVSMPMRLVLEWLSAHHGNQLINGIRLAALASATHDGLGDDLYAVVHRAVLHSVGQAAFPMLFALRQLCLLTSRSGHAVSTLANSQESTDATERAPTTVATSSSLLERTSSSSSAALSRLTLAKRHKSVYNRLHYLLRLSHVGQTNRRVNQTPVSASYVYAGQHCPTVVRLAESVWSSALSSLAPASMASTTSASADASTSKAQLVMDAEVVVEKQLKSAMTFMGFTQEEASTLGLVNLDDPSAVAASYHRAAPNENPPSKKNTPIRPRSNILAADQPVLVVFPGGCTYGEVAALRFTATRRRWRLIIATSSLISSRDLLQQAGQAVMDLAGAL